MGHKAVSVHYHCGVEGVAADIHGLDHAGPFQRNCRNSVENGNSLCYDDFGQNYESGEGIFGVTDRIGDFLASVLGIYLDFDMTLMMPTFS